MSWKYSFIDSINLFVKERIGIADSERQKCTAVEILRHLENQPGIILADEVGMGKTFVALAVGISVALQDKRKRPVVVMVPSSLKQKWPNDFNVFLDKCLPLKIKNKIRYETAENTVEFLKLIDDKDNKCSIIFLTHGALHSGLNDPWVKLAFIQKALHRRKNINHIYRALNKFAGSLLWLKYIENKNRNIFGALLSRDPINWKKYLIRKKIFTKDKDDPVPYDLIKILKKLESKQFSKLFSLLYYNLPERDSKNIDDKIKDIRKLINEELKDLWKKCIENLSVSSPLLILDEAHHLKNAKTRIASLFSNEEASDDANIISRGALANVFDRMIFLTATPFQLGHHELCNILDRFIGINWNKVDDNIFNRAQYKYDILQLRELLDKSQETALRFDNAWGRITKEELNTNSQTFDDIEKWWDHISSTDISNLSSIQEIILQRYNDVRKTMNNALPLLQKYVIRHIKDKTLKGKYEGKIRRNEIIGDGIINNDISTENGIILSGNSILPFLLSARLSSLKPESRPVFAEGLSSSFEAFLETRKKGIKDSLDCDDNSEENIFKDKQSLWYLENIQNCIISSFNERKINHPKIDAVIQKAIELWLKGEKVLIFCHYIETGKALRNYISSEIESLIKKKASEKIGCSEEIVFDELDKIGQRFESEKYLLRREFDKKINELVNNYEELIHHKNDIILVIRRYFKSPSFLLRFYPLSKGIDKSELLKEAFETKDGSELFLTDVINNFLRFLSKRCVPKERENYINALKSVQPGSIRIEDNKEFYSSEEFDKDKPKLMPNVRLVNGRTKQEFRQRLMLTFNTPFYPDILITSSVLAEGVDLHLNCRYIIHHDLCWNPSTLEQRTGRVDRIGAKVEICGQPINIYLPYISETQDEKMYKVVMDRGRWFNILMGENYKVDFITTEKLANRIPIPDTIVNSLKFRLGVYDNNS